MKVIKPEFNLSKTQQLALLGAGTILFLTPAVGATQLVSTKATVETSQVQLHTDRANLANTSFQLAQNTCPPNAGGGRLVNYFETANFYVYMCRTSKGLFYTGIDKNNGKGTRPLRAITEEGTGYVVQTGNITYIVNGASLSIYRGNKLLQEERVLKAR